MNQTAHERVVVNNIGEFKIISRIFTTCDSFESDLRDALYAWTKYHCDRFGSMIWTRNPDGILREQLTCEQLLACDSFIDSFLLAKGWYQSSYTDSWLRLPFKPR